MPPKRHCTPPPNRTPTSLSDLTAGRRFSASSHSALAAVTGRWSGVGGALQWVWPVPLCPVKVRTQGQGLATMANHGVWSCQTCAALLCTTTRSRRSQWRTAPEWACSWTRRRSLWPSMVLMMCSCTYTRSTASRPVGRCLPLLELGAASVSASTSPTETSARLQTALKSAPSNPDHSITFSPDYWYDLERYSEVSRSPHTRVPECHFKNSIFLSTKCFFAVCWV